jgi:hypothetical protein
MRERNGCATNTMDESSGNGALDRFIMEWYRRKATFVGASEERDFVETLSLRLPE